MDIDHLKQSIKADIHSENFTLQAIFDQYIDDIMLLKKEGYQYKRIRILLELDIHDKHFRDLLYRARKKKKSKSHTSVSPKTETKAIDHHINVNTSPTLSPDDWGFKTSIES